MPSEYQTISEKLLAVKVMLDNASTDQEILRLLDIFNYGEQKVTGGVVLHTEVSDLVASQKKEFGEQVGATDDLNKTWDEAKKPYSNAYQIARIAFKYDPGALKELLLIGKRKESLNGWLEQANVFYTNLLNKEEYLQAMARYGYVRKKLEMESIQVSAVADANSKQEAEKGDVVTATLVRDKALDKLDEWTADFKKVARIALDGHDGLLKKLGIYEKEGKADEEDESDDEENISPENNV